MRNVGAIKRSARGSGNVAAREKLKAMNRKYHASDDPLQRESLLDTIKPSAAQEIEGMTTMLDKLYKKGTKEQQQALQLWKFQVANGSVKDQVRLQFLRRFYFWLLGRGEDADVAKTLWGRGNAAALNSEVAAYIDQFVDKRSEYALKLHHLSQRVPQTINGYYLYYKYIVNGALKRVEGADGKTFWDMSNEDYLEDFDIFQQVFQERTAFGGKRTTDQYADLISPMANYQGDTRPYEGKIPYPLTTDQLRRQQVQQLQGDAMEQNAVSGLDVSLNISKDAREQSAFKEEERKEIEREREENGQVIGPRVSDIGLRGRSAAPPVKPSDGMGDVSGATGGRRESDFSVPEDTPSSSIAYESGSIDKGKDELIPEPPMIPETPIQQDEMKALQKEWDDAYEAFDEGERKALDKFFDDLAEQGMSEDEVFEQIFRFIEANENKSPAFEAKLKKFAKAGRVFQRAALSSLTPLEGGSATLDTPQADQKKFEEARGTSDLSRTPYVNMRNRESLAKATNIKKQLYEEISASDVAEEASSSLSDAVNTSISDAIEIAKDLDSSVSSAGEAREVLDSRAEKLLKNNAILQQEVDRLQKIVAQLEAQDVPADEQQAQLEQSMRELSSSIASADSLVNSSVLLRKTEAYEEFVKEINAKYEKEYAGKTHSAKGAVTKRKNAELAAKRAELGLDAEDKAKAVLKKEEKEARKGEFGDYGGRDAEGMEQRSEDSDTSRGDLDSWVVADTEFEEVEGSDSDGSYVKGESISDLSLEDAAKEARFKKGQRDEKWNEKPAKDALPSSGGRVKKTFRDRKPYLDTLQFLKNEANSTFTPKLISASDKDGEIVMENFDDFIDLDHWRYNHRDERPTEKWKQNFYTELRTAYNSLLYDYEDSSTLNNILVRDLGDDEVEVRLIDGGRQNGLANADFRLGRFYGGDGAIFEPKTIPGVKELGERRLRPRKIKKQDD